MKVSGATGASIGIIHDAKPFLTDNFGFRDVSNKLPPDQDTIYYLASLTKSFTAAGLAHLIHNDTELDWDTLVADAYKPLSHQDLSVRQPVTIVHMSVNIVLPSLTNWAQQHLTTLFQTTNQDDFNAAFDAFISKHVKITVNGKSLTRDEYKQQLQAEKFEESGAQINFLGTVEVPKDANQPVLVGFILFPSRPQ